MLAGSSSSTRANPTQRPPAGKEAQAECRVGCCLRVQGSELLKGAAPWKDLDLLMPKDVQGDGQQDSIYMKSRNRQDSSEWTGREGRLGPFGYTFVDSSDCTLEMEAFHFKNHTSISFSKGR